MTNKDESTENKCPICNFLIRSDAELRISCALCGMGIPNADFAPRYETLDGTPMFFCCDKCMELYVQINLNE